MGEISREMEKQSRFQVVRMNVGMQYIRESRVDWICKRGSRKECAMEVLDGMRGKEKAVEMGQDA